MKLFKKRDLAGRAGLIDEIRGALIILVVIYHAVYLYYNMLPVLMPVWLESLQPLVYIGAGAFIFISGICTNFSRNNFRRGLVCFLIACAITLITLVWDGGRYQVLWGILHLIGFSIILCDLLSKPIAKMKAVWAVPVLLLLFVLTFRISSHALGIPYLLEWQFQPIDLEFLFPIGLTHNSFFSADYYPLIPWFFLFLTGVFAGRWVKSDKCSAFVYKTRVKPLAFLGRHTLIIYLVHIPVIAGVYYLISLF